MRRHGRGCDIDFVAVKCLVAVQGVGRGKKRKQQALESDQDSPHSWQERGEGSKVIAEAGMILRDPSALHLLIKQVHLVLRFKAATPLSALQNTDLHTSNRVLWCAADGSAYLHCVVNGS